MRPPGALWKSSSVSSRAAESWLPAIYVSWLGYLEFNMFLVLVKVSSIMSLSYVESLVPKKDCDHNSRKILKPYSSPCLPASRKLRRTQNFWGKVENTPKVSETDRKINTHVTAASAPFLRKPSMAMKWHKKVNVNSNENSNGHVRADEVQLLSSSHYPSFCLCLAGNSSMDISGTWGWKCSVSLCARSNFIMGRLGEVVWAYWRGRARITSGCVIIQS